MVSKPVHQLTNTPETLLLHNIGFDNRVRGRLHYPLLCDGNQRLKKHLIILTYSYHDYHRYGDHELKAMDNYRHIGVFGGQPNLWNQFEYLAIEIKKM